MTEISIKHLNIAKALFKEKSSAFNDRKIHFVGIAGSGMNPLARFLKLRGNYKISGSDRSFDNKDGEYMKSLLISQGINVVPQDGKLIDESIDLLIASGAIESNIPDVKNAVNLNIPIITRPQLLAEIANGMKSIAIGGTSGKTTVTAMTGLVFKTAALKPNVICGGLMKNLNDFGKNDNIYIGASDYIIFEADESDGSLVNYYPETGIILNITKDHKPMPELKKIFASFLYHCKNYVILNNSLLEKQILPFTKNIKSNVITFGLSPNADIYPENVVMNSWSSSFSVKNIHFNLKVPGKHNIENALATIALSFVYDINLKIVSDALKQFNGVARRLDIIGKFNDITVIDDFAHNPDKIFASLKTVIPTCKRVLVIYQPHGFGPTNFMKNELISTFENLLRPSDMLFIPDIYYAGGTVSRTVSSRDIVDPLKKYGILAYYIPERKNIAKAIKENVQKHDAILVMGARDDTLTTFANKLFQMVKS